MLNVGTSRELVEQGAKWLAAVQLYVRRLPPTADSLAWIGVESAVREAVDQVELAHDKNCETGGVR
jgi:hypothetical protein